MERHCCLIRHKHLAFCDYTSLMLLLQYLTLLLRYVNWPLRFVLLSIRYVGMFNITLFNLFIVFCAFPNTFCGHFISLCHYG